MITYENLPPYEQAQLLHEAIEFAKRRCSAEDLIHGLEVLQILETGKAPIETKLAAIMHSCRGLEDLEAIEIRFGKLVAGIIWTCTEDLQKSWLDSRLELIAIAKDAHHFMQFFIMADKIAEQRELVYQYRACGEDVWENQNQPKATLEWYYSTIQDALFDLSKHEDSLYIYWEMVDLFKELFVKFYRLGEDSFLQVTEKEVHAFNPETLAWEDITKTADRRDLLSREDCVEIEQELMEQLEELVIARKSIKKKGGAASCMN